MNLTTLLQPFSSELFDIPDITLTGIQNDSRHVMPGDLFIAYPGVTADGRDYIEQAIQAGAAAVLYEPHGFTLNMERFYHIPFVPLERLSQRLAVLANQFYDTPSRKLSIIGVTGTNGKTTVAYQLAQAYQLLGKKAAYIGTIGQGEVQQLLPLPNTTPDALCLQKLLHSYVVAGIEYVCMEVSSHALSLGRVDGIQFSQAIYTNLSHDHLDFHQTMDAYAAAKASLFSKLSLQHVVINTDDAYSQLMQANVPSSSQQWLYGLESSSNIRALRWSSSMSGSQVDITSPWGDRQIQLKSLGKFNIYNSLAVFASLMASAVGSLDDIVEVMGQLNPSPGRMEIVAQKPCVVVDYAHSPDALENVLSTLVSLKPEKLWVIFGCGGDRDKTKRPIMGKVAYRYADVVILTNDNPRSEDPLKIMEEIRFGITDDSDVVTIPDREKAIHYALKHAQQNDMVLIAGKGHEDYQIIGSERTLFSDQQVVREYYA